MRTPHSNSRRSRAGFTLLEVVISIGIFALIIGSLVTATATGTGTFETNFSTTALEGRARRGMSTLSEALAGARSTALVPSPAPPLGSSTLTFQSAVGYDGTGTVWGPSVQFVLEYSPLEIDNGIDDDGNGLIDECVVIRIDDPGLPTQRRSTIASDVAEFATNEVPDLVDNNGNGLIDERGLSFSLNGRALTIDLALEKLGPNQQHSTRTSQKTILLRN